MSLPRLEDFASDTLTARTGELFNPPGLTNFFGCLQAHGVHRLPPPAAASGLASLS